MNKNVVSLHIHERWKGSYNSLFYWVIWVDGCHWMTGRTPYFSADIARKHGVIQLLKLDGYFTAWRLSE